MDSKIHIDFDRVLRHVGSDEFWPDYLSQALENSATAGLHLAVFAEPYLSLALSGSKTIDLRLARIRCAPYGQVHEGDIILLKETAGPVRGLSLARRVWCYDLNSGDLGRIRERFGTEICADGTYWALRSVMKYATLIELAFTVGIPATNCNKRDRRGWVPLRLNQSYQA